MLKLVLRSHHHIRKRMGLIDLIKKCSTISKVDKIKKVRTSSIKSTRRFEESNFVNHVEDNQDDMDGLENLTDLPNLNNVQFTDPLIEKINERIDITTLLTTIEPKINNLTPEQLNHIYLNIARLVIQSKNSPQYRKLTDYKNLCEIVLTSSTFQLLLEHTFKIINDLDPTCLLKVFKTFSQLNLDPDHKIVKQTIKKLNNELEFLELDEILEFLNSLNYYSKNSLFSSFTFLKLRKSFLERVKSKIQNNEFDQISSVIKCFYIFLEFDDYESVDHLARTLVSGDKELNFRQSVFILKYVKLKNFKLKRTEYGNEFSFPLSVNKLVDKCNLIIYQELASSPNEEVLTKVTSYIDKLHSLRDGSIEIPNFYDKRILKVINPVLISNSRKIPSIKYKSIRIAYNYSICDIYDEELIKFIYELINSSYILRSELGFNDLIRLFYRLKLSFVDYERLAYFSLELFNGKIKDYPMKKLEILCEFILHDINDGNVFDYFDEQKTNLNDFNKIQFSQAKLISLARVYLSMFSELDENIKKKLEIKLDGVLKNISIADKMPKISMRFNSISPKLQRNGYLSNGVYLDQFAIYDKSIQDLIPLTKFKSYFHKVDQMPLEPNQELVTFIDLIPKNKGFENLEYNYDYCLKKVLKECSNIKIIEIFKDEILQRSNYKERVIFFINKVRDSYKL